MPPNGSVPYDDQKLGFNKIAPYYYYPGWWEGGPQTTAMISLTKWNELPKAYQAVIEAASAYGAGLDAVEVRRARIPRRCASWWPAAPS